MDIIEFQPDTKPPFLLPGTKYFMSKVHDGYLRMIVAVEPFNDDLAHGLHVSISHSSRGGAVNRFGRAATDAELKEIADHFFVAGMECEENNVGGTPGDTLRHLWEKRVEVSQEVLQAQGDGP